MKLLFTLISVLFITTLTAQDFTGFNQGQVNQKGYYTTVPYTLKRDKLIIQVELNGKLHNFLFDTGAPTSISAELAAELNSPLMSKIEIVDANDLKDSLQVVKLDNLKIGDVTFKDTPVLVIKDFGPLGCLNIDGFIGSNMLRNSIVHIASKTKTITLTDVAKKLPLNRKNSVKMVVEPGQSSPLISIDLVTKDITADETLLVDTGMSGFYDLSTAVYDNAKQYNLFTTLGQATGFFTIGLYGVAKAEQQYKVGVPGIAIGRNGFSNVTATTTSDKRSRIGIEILKHGNITLDYKNGRFYFDPFGDVNNIDLTEKTWPFKPIIKDEKMIVGIVWDKALEAQLKPGDEILSFGSHNLTGLDTCQKLLFNMDIPQDSAPLVIKDAKTGETRTVQVVKQ